MCGTPAQALCAASARAAPPNQPADSSIPARNQHATSCAVPAVQCELPERSMINQPRSQTQGTTPNPSAPPPRCSGCLRPFLAQTQAHCASDQLLAPDAERAVRPAQLGGHVVSFAVLPLDVVLFVRGLWHLLLTAHRHCGACGDVPRNHSRGDDIRKDGE